MNDNLYPDPYKFSSKLFDPNDPKFDKVFEAHHKLIAKNVTRTFCMVFAIWCAWVLICLTALVGLAFVAWHFLSKIW